MAQELPTRRRTALGGPHQRGHLQRLHRPNHSWPKQGAALGVDMAFDERRMHSK